MHDCNERKDGGTERKKARGFRKVIWIDGEEVRAHVDEVVRESVEETLNGLLDAEMVVDVLVNLFMSRGVPKYIRSDNGPEFIANAISKHVERTDLEMLYVEPGSPWENGFAESFLNRLRDELLNCEEFANLAEARWFARRRQEEHNEERPHSSLNYETPSAFAAGCAAASAPAHPRSQTITLITPGTEIGGTSIFFAIAF